MRYKFILSNQQLQDRMNNEKTSLPLTSIQTLKKEGKKKNQNDKKSTYAYRLYGLINMGQTHRLGNQHYINFRYKKRSHAIALKLQRQERKEYFVLLFNKKTTKQGTNENSTISHIIHIPNEIETSKKKNALNFFSITKIETNECTVKFQNVLRS